MATMMRRSTPEALSSATIRDDNQHPRPESSRHDPLLELNPEVVCPSPVRWSAYTLADNAVQDHRPLPGEDEPRGMSELDLHYELRQVTAEIERTSAKSDALWNHYREAKLGYDATTEAYDEARKHVNSKYDNPLDREAYLRFYEELWDTEWHVVDTALTELRSTNEDLQNLHLHRARVLTRLLHQRRAESQAGVPSALHKGSGQEDTSSSGPTADTVPATADSTPERSSTESLKLRRNSAVYYKSVSNLDQLRSSRASTDLTGDRPGRSVTRGRPSVGLRSNSAPSTIARRTNLYPTVIVPTRPRSAGFQRKGANEHLVRIINPHSDSLPYGSEAEVLNVSNDDDFTIDTKDQSRDALQKSSEGSSNESQHPSLTWGTASSSYPTKIPDRVPVGSKDLTHSASGYKMSLTPGTFPNHEDDESSNGLPRFDLRREPVPLSNEDDFSTSRSGHQMADTPGSWLEELPESVRTACDLHHSRTSTPPTDLSLTRQYSLSSPDDQATATMLNRFHLSRLSEHETTSPTVDFPTRADSVVSDVDTELPSMDLKGSRAGSFTSVRSFKDRATDGLLSAWSSVSRATSRALSGLNSTNRSRASLI
ncbi:hypothetical protein IAT40_001513 [Kwoniella sp. CBS 6097]